MAVEPASMTLPSSWIAVGDPTFWLWAVVIAVVCEFTSVTTYSPWYSASWLMTASGVGVGTGDARSIGRHMPKRTVWVSGLILD